MADYNDRRRSRGGRDSGRREMFSAVCANCGDNCEVPFKPSGDKPVLCSNCFEKSGGGNRRSSGGPRGDRRGSSPDVSKMARQLNFMEEKIDAIIEMLQNNASSHEIPSDLGDSENSSDND